MSWRAPAVRARGLQDALAYLRGYDAEAYEAMRRRLPPETWRIVNESAKTAWIDVQYEAFIVNSWVPVLGEARAIEVVAIRWLLIGAAMADGS